MPEQLDEVNFVFFDCEEKVTGQIVGNASGAKAKVKWASGEISELKASTRYRKVINGSIEHLALEDSKKCLLLFQEDPEEFFSILLNYSREHLLLKKGIDQNLILGKNKSDPNCMRARIVDSGGNQLFPDRQIFKSALLELSKILKKKGGSSKLEIIQSGEKDTYTPKLPLSLSLDGKIKEEMVVTILDLSSANKLDLEQHLESFNPNTMLEKLVHLALTSQEKPARLIINWKDILKEAARLIPELKPDGFQRLLKNIARLGKSWAKEIFAVAEIALSRGSNATILEDYADTSLLLDAARSLSITNQNDTSDDLYLQALCAYLDSKDYKLNLEKDVVLVPHILKLSRSTNYVHQVILSLVADWLDANPGWHSNKVNKRIFLEILQNSGSNFTSARIKLLKIAGRNFAKEISNKKYWRGLTFRAILENEELFDLLSNVAFSEILMKPLFVQMRHKQLEPELLGRILAYGKPLYLLLKNWGLIEILQESIEMLSNDGEPWAKELLFPKKLYENFQLEKSASTTAQLQLKALTAESKALSRSFAKLEDDLAKTKEQLRIALEGNRQRQASKVKSAVFSCARAFAESARMWRLAESNDGSKFQLMLSVDARLANSGIKSIYKPDEIVPFELTKMELVDANVVNGANVRVIDPLYELEIEGQHFILTKALVTSKIE